MSDEWVEVSNNKKKSKSNSTSNNSNSNNKKNGNNDKKNGNKNFKKVSKGNDTKSSPIQSKHNNNSINSINKNEMIKDDIDKNNSSNSVDNSVDITNDNSLDILDTVFDKMQITYDNDVINSNNDNNNNDDNINGQVIDNEEKDNVYKPTIKEFCMTSRDILIQFFSDSNSSNNSNSNVRCVGMLNTGNACYRNCIIQILLSLPPFYYTLNHLVELYPFSNLPNELKGWKQILSFFVEYKKMIYKNGKLISALTKEVPVINPEQSLRDLFETFKSKVHPNGVPTVSVITKGKGNNVKQIASQEDSQEFLTFLLDTLDEEMNSIKEEEKEKESPDTVNQEESGWETVNKARVKEVVDDTSREDAIRKSASTIISRLFHGTIRSEVIYSNKKISSRFQIVTQIQIELYELQQKAAVNRQQSRNNKKDSASVSLSPSINISDAIKLYFAEEDLESGTKKRVKLESAPQILILHLKRFTFDYSKNIPIKMNNEVTYDVNLTIPMEYLSPDLMAKCIKNLQNLDYNSNDDNHRDSDSDSDDSSSISGIKYRLIGLILHHGNNATGGHYTTIAKESDDSWKSMDDSSAKYISQQEALDGRKQVYLLFYEKI